MAGEPGLMAPLIKAEAAKEQSLTLLVTWKERLTSLGVCLARAQLSALVV